MTASPRGRAPATGRGGMRCAVPPYASCSGAGLRGNEVDEPPALAPGRRADAIRLLRACAAQFDSETPRPPRLPMKRLSTGNTKMADCIRPTLAPIMTSPCSSTIPARSPKTSTSWHRSRRPFCSKTGAVISAKPFEAGAYAAPPPSCTMFVRTASIGEIGNRRLSRQSEAMPWRSQADCRPAVT
jgi:hypothetical protein